MQCGDQSKVNTPLPQQESVPERYDIFDSDDDARPYELRLELDDIDWFCLNRCFMDLSVAVHEGGVVPDISLANDASIFSEHLVSPDLWMDDGQLNVCKEVNEATRLRWRCCADNLSSKTQPCPLTGEWLDPAETVDDVQCIATCYSIQQMDIMEAWVAHYILMHLHEYDDLKNEWDTICSDYG